MTKKAQKILKEFEEKLQMVDWMYEKEFYDMPKHNKEYRDECNQFQEMISGMLHFNMLSQSDFSELWKQSIR